MPRTKGSPATLPGARPRASAHERETTLTLTALETDTEVQPPLSDRIAMVRAQLEPIRSRPALLDSYRRESLCRLASATTAPGSATEVLDLAYAMRWLELDDDQAGSPPVPTQNGLVDE